MTIEEAKQKYGTSKKNGYVFCCDCPLYETNDCLCECAKDCSGYTDTHEAIAKYMTEQETTTPTNDIINHPSHYCRDGGMECIEEMILVFGVKNTIRFCLMNSHKYRYRSADKNGEEDMRKSDWYYKKAQELMKCHNIENWWD